MSKSKGFRKWTTEPQTLYSDGKPFSVVRIDIVKGMRKFSRVRIYHLGRTGAPFGRFFQDTVESLPSVADLAARTIANISSFQPQLWRECDCAQIMGALPWDDGGLAKSYRRNRIFTDQASYVTLMSSLLAAGSDFKRKL